MSILACSLYMGIGTLPPVQTLIPSSEHFGRISSEFSMFEISYSSASSHLPNDSRVASPEEEMLHYLR